MSFSVVYCLSVRWNPPTNICCQLLLLPVVCMFTVALYRNNRVRCSYVKHVVLRYKTSMYSSSACLQQWGVEKLLCFLSDFDLLFYVLFIKLAMERVWFKGILYIICSKLHWSRKTTWQRKPLLHLKEYVRTSAGPLVFNWTWVMDWSVKNIQNYWSRPIPLIVCWFVSLWMIVSV